MYNNVGPKTLTHISLNYPQIYKKGQKKIGKVWLYIFKTTKEVQIRKKQQNHKSNLR